MSDRSASVLRRTRHRLALVATCAIFLCFVPHVAAINGQFLTEDAFREPWRWRLFGTESGLASRAVADIVESEQGETWAVTAGGIAWFDDYVWRTVPPSPALSGVNFAQGDLVVDGRQLIFISGASAFIGGRGGFKQLTQDGRPVRATGAVRLRAGRFLLVPANDGCLVVAEGTTVPCEPGDAPAGTVTSARGLRSGSVWVSTAAGIYERYRGSWSLRAPNEGPRLYVSDVAEGPDGSAYVLVSEESGKGIRFWKFSPDRAVPTEASTVMPWEILCFDVNPAGDLLVVHRDGHVTVRGAHSPETVITSVPLEVKSARAVHFRANGDLWLASEFGAHLFLSGSRLWQFQKNQGDSRAQMVNALLTASDGATWVGRDLGIEVRPSGGAAFTLADKGPLVLSAVTGLAEDTKRRIWATSGSGFTGAYSWDGRAWRHAGSEDGLADVFYHRVTADRKGRLWFLGSTPPTEQDRLARRSGGVPCFVLEGGTFRRVDVPIPAVPGRVYAFAEASDGTLWFGTSAGLYRLKDGQWKSWTTTDGLQSARVFSLTVDPADDVWFADQDTGIGVLRRGVLQYFTTRDGLGGDSVWEVASGPDGAIWISSRNALTRYKDGFFARVAGFRELGGLAIWPVLPLKDRVLVGTHGGGTASLDVASIPAEPPRVVIDEPVYSGSSVTLRWISATYLGDEPLDSVECRFSLDDGEWSAWHAQHSLVVERLPVGVYALRVQARSRYGQTDPEGTSIVFRVAAPWYRHPTLLAALAVVALAGTLLISIAAVRWRRMQQRVAKHEARLRAIVDDESDSVIRFLPDGTLTFMNPAFALLQDRYAFQLLGSNVLNLLADDPARFVDSLRRLTPQSPALSFERRTVSAAGDDRFVVWSVHGIFDRNGVLSEFQAVGHDISEMKRQAERRQQEETRLLASQKLESLGRLAGGIAHRFNNLLTTVLGHASLMSSDPSDGDAIRESATEIRHAAEEAAGLSRLMLVYSGQSPTRTAPISLATLVREMRPLLEVTAHNRCSVLLQLTDAMPAVQMDASQVRQMLLTFVSNAVEASTKRGSSIVISCGCKSCSREDLDRCELGSALPKGDYAFLEVADDGEGMPSDVKARIFEPFFTTKFVGRGLGLSAVHGIVRSHRGAISVESAPGKGTAIRVLLPLAVDGVQSDVPGSYAPETAEKIAGATTPDGSSPR